MLSPFRERKDQIIFCAQRNDIGLGKRTDPAEKAARDSGYNYGEAGKLHAIQLSSNKSVSNGNFALMSNHSPVYLMRLAALRTNTTLMKKLRLPILHPRRV